MKDTDWKLPSERYLTTTEAGRQAGKSQDEKDLRKSLTILEMTRRVIEPDYPLLAENIETHLSQLTKIKKLMATNEEIMAIKHKENEECLDRLQDIVQNKIVPVNPVHVAGRLQTLDKAVAYYIELVEHKTNLLAQLLEKLEKQKIWNEGYIGHPDHEYSSDYHIGGTTAYGFCIDELNKILPKKQ